MPGTKLLIASVAILVATTGQVQAALIVTIYQDGANVTAKWNEGFLDLYGARIYRPYDWPVGSSDLYHGVADLNGVAIITNPFDARPPYFETTSFVQSAGWTSGAGITAYTEFDVTTGGSWGSLLAVWVGPTYFDEQMRNWFVFGSGHGNNGTFSAGSGTIYNTTLAALGYTPGESIVATFASGDTATLQIAPTSNPVPEPTSMVMWLFAVVCAIASRRSLVTRWTNK